MRTETKQILKHETKVFWWDSLTEFGAAAIPLITEDKLRGSWTGETAQEVRRKVQFGDSTNVHRAEGLLEDLVLQIETPTMEWGHSVSGVRPCIPSALVGRPDSMMRRIEVESDRAPVVIAVDVTSSGGIDVRSLQTRGINLLAMAMAISAIRPMELYVLSALSGWGGKTGINAIRVGTTPLDLAMACYALTSQGVCRGLGYNYLNQKAGTTGGWAWGIHPAGEGREKYGKAMRVALGGDNHFRFIPPIHLHDELLTNPAEFIRRSIREIEELEDL
jgi:hypothetical protein